MRQGALVRGPGVGGAGPSGLGRRAPDSLLDDGDALGVRELDLDDVHMPKGLLDGQEDRPVVHEEAGALPLLYRVHF